MFVDLHAHTSGISRCCKKDYKGIIEDNLSHGFDGMVLCNHFETHYIDGFDYDEFVDKYNNEFIQAKNYGKEKNFKVIYGIEITMEFDRRVHMLLYGADFSFLHKHKNIFDYSAEALYNACKEDNVCLVQGHPYRAGILPLPIEYVDGYEVNCHAHHGPSHLADIEELNRKTGVLVTCGCDYHADDYRPKGGMILPDSIEDTFDLRDYLLTTNKTEIVVHEPATEDIIKKEFIIKR